MFEIRRTGMEDLVQLEILYEQARNFMKGNKNPDQWKDNYPVSELLIEDIKRGSSYVCVEDHQIVGTFYFALGDEPEYKNIYEGNWLDEEEYFVVHRIAASSYVKGVGSFCLNWCMHQYNNIRIDTHRRNQPMQNLLQKLGFERCGVIYLENGDERIAFQKKMKDEMRSE